MPELPEVETVRRILNKSIIGKKILGIDIRYDKIIQNVSVEEFKKSLINQTFINVNRKGKYLICELNDYYLLVHLRMEGKFFLMHDEELSKHDHIIFKFEDSNLRYNDTRKFGTMHLFKKDIDIYNVYPLNKVGLEPFDEKFTKEYLQEKFKNNTRPIKTALLDQEIVAGLGNIYVDEVLFMSSIYPKTRAKDVNIEQLDKIVESSRIVLNKAINLGGTTIRSFQSSHDITGRFQNELLVHTKEICQNCNSKIEKIKVGGRGTYYCPVCQK
ncbi:MAG: DNA-formamidopyrimidine glycosylase [Bacilli bacterium]|nr:DNA-formamidopyrimidine glycosylase [Bacilli bacterium]